MRKEDRVSLLQVLAACFSSPCPLPSSFCACGFDGGAQFVTQRVRSHLIGIARSIRGGVPDDAVLRVAKSEFAPERAFGPTRVGIDQRLSFAFIARPFKAQFFDVVLQTTLETLVAAPIIGVEKIDVVQRNRAGVFFGFGARKRR